MGRKWYQPEQIISKLREAEVLLAKRDTVGHLIIIDGTVVLTVAVQVVGVGTLENTIPFDFYKVTGLGKRACQYGLACSVGSDFVHKMLPGTWTRFRGAGPSR